MHRYTHTHTNTNTHMSSSESGAHRPKRNTPHKYVHIYKYLHSYIHIYTHKHIHTRTHTYMYPSQSAPPEAQYQTHTARSTHASTRKETPARKGSRGEVTAWDALPAFNGVGAPKDEEERDEANRREEVRKTFDRVMRLFGGGVCVNVRVLVPEVSERRGLVAHCLEARGHTLRRCCCSRAAGARCVDVPPPAV